ncbi:DUF4365 domain-containing protein [Escherichia coli]|nr:DUF4365 domain-containing protein [Escherichia coli]WCQ56133.1 DUF4365 domain-containing protein [Escherichia coli]
MGHIFRENTNRDFGVDGQIEIVIESSGERNASGRLIAVQIKCGDSFFLVMMVITGLIILVTDMPIIGKVFQSLSFL